MDMQVLWRVWLGFLVMPMTRKANTRPGFPGEVPLEPASLRDE